MRKFVAGVLVGIVISLVSVAGASTQVVRMFVNGNEVVSDVPPTIIDGRVLVPARALAESLGANVEWNEEEWAVNITSKVEPTVATASPVEPAAPPGKPVAPNYNPPAGVAKVIREDGVTYVLALKVADILIGKGITFTGKVDTLKINGQVYTISPTKFIGGNMYWSVNNLMDAGYVTEDDLSKL